VLLSLQDDLRDPKHGLVREGGDESTELGDEDAEAVRAGALRPLEFNPTEHVVLGEELKHLYTAITRSKSNVIFSDRSAKLRAPFYRLLRSLGLARAVRESLLADGQHHGLSRVRSGPAEWAARARNLLDNDQPGVAADCFARAGDAPRSLAARGMALAAQAAALETGREARSLQLRAADALLTAAAYAPKAEEAEIALSVAAAATAAAARVAAEEAAAAAASNETAATEAVPCGACIVPASDAERSVWLGRAAAAFVRAEEWGAASELYLLLKRYARAGTCLLRMSQPKKAAEAFERGAEVASGEASIDLLLKALRAYLTARSSSAALALLQRNPALSRAAADAGIDISKAATEAATTAHSAGRRADAVSALRHVASRALREKLLRSFGYWSELAQGMPDPSVAADFLLQHVGPREAAIRLRAALSLNPAVIAPKLHALLLCAASREIDRDDGARMAASAAALWTAGSGLPWADATLQAGRLRGDAQALHAAFDVYREAARPLAQLSALAKLAKLSAELNANECAAAVPALRVACRAMGALSNRADSFAMAQLDALYGGLGLASGALALGKNSAATVALPADEWQLSSCVERAAAAYPAASLAAARDACSILPAPPGKPLPPRSVPWRAALGAVLLDLYDDCVAVVDAVAASYIAASEQRLQAGDSVAAAEAAFSALQMRSLREQLQLEANQAGRSGVLALPSVVLSPLATAAATASKALRHTATLALCRALFPLNQPGGVNLAALDVFSAAFATPDDDPRRKACVAVLQDCEATYDRTPRQQHAGADGGACADILWRMFALAAPDRLESLRRRVRSARDLTKRNAASARSMALAGVATAVPPPLTVRGLAYSSPLALLLAARDATDADPAFAAHAMLHFVDFHRRFAPGFAQDSHRTLVEMAAGAALGALGVLQVAIAPAAWLHAYSRLRGRARAPPTPVGAEAVARAVKAAAAALARALRLALTTPGEATALSLAPICLLLTTAVPEAPASTPDLAPLAHIAWSHVSALCDSPNGAIAAAAKAADLAAHAAEPSRRNVVPTLLSLAQAVAAPAELSLLRLMPNWQAVPFDGMARPKKDSKVKEQAYAPPPRSGRVAEAAARLLKPLTDSELVDFGNNLDPLAPSEAQQAAASAIQRCWRVRRAERAAAALQARRAAALAAARAAVAADRYRYGAAAALRRWAARVSATLRERKEAAFQEELARARSADLAASLADRLRSLAAAAEAPESTASCPICPRASSAPLAPPPAAAPAAAGGLRVSAAEFVPRARHVAGDKHITAAAAFATYQAAYLDAACPALAAAETWSAAMMRNVSDAVVAQDSAVDAARNQLNALLSDAEERRDWAGAEAEVRARAAALSAACVAAHAALASQQAREAATDEPEAEEDDWEDVVSNKKRRNHKRGGQNRRGGHK